MSDSRMLVSRAQLDFVQKLIGEFATHRPEMKPVEVYQSSYIAIVVMLRSIGHVFEKVDCNTCDRKRWCNERWAIWKREPIFSEFIEPARNSLLKEFQGGLQLDSGGMGSPAFFANPAKPDMIDTVVGFDPREARVDGKPILHLIQEAAGFWDKALLDAEKAWKISS